MRLTSWWTPVRRRGTAVSASAFLTLTLCPLPSGAADPSPSARDVTQSRQEVRRRASEIGEVKARLAQANGELHELVVATQVAVERYNGEVVKQERARRAHQQATDRVAAAEQRHEQARLAAARFAADAYRASSARHDFVMLVGGGGPQGTMDRAGLMEMLARRKSGVLDQMRATQTVADLFRRQAHDALREQRAATVRAATARAAAQRAVARQEAAVVRIAAEQKRLERQLSRAEARTAALARRRRAALAAGRGVGRVSGSGRGPVAARAALKWLGTPYSWGGGTAAGPSHGIDHGARIKGFDCSGLALYAWDKAGVRLDHWTGTQWTSGPRVPTDRLLTGDLVFFAHDRGDPDTIHHVGIYIGSGRMVEAPYTGARVRISSIWRGDLIGAVRPGG